MQLNDAMFGFARTQQGRDLLNKYGYREAFEGDVSNLLKRHQLERGMPLNQLQQQLGHADIRTTQHYLHWLPELNNGAQDLMADWEGVS